MCCVQERKDSGKLSEYLASKDRIKNANYDLLSLKRLGEKNFNKRIKTFAFRSVKSELSVLHV